MVVAIMIAVITIINKKKLSMTSTPENPKSQKTKFKPVRLLADKFQFSKFQTTSTLSKVVNL
jgi:hypothetical protein